MRLQCDCNAIAMRLQPWRSMQLAALHRRSGLSLSHSMKFTFCDDRTLCSIANQTIALHALHWPASVGLVTLLQPSSPRVRGSCVCTREQRLRVHAVSGDGCSGPLANGVRGLQAQYPRSINNPSSSYEGPNVSTTPTSFVRERMAGEPLGSPARPGLSLLTFEQLRQHHQPAPSTGLDAGSSIRCA